MNDFSSLPIEKTVAIYLAGPLKVKTQDIDKYLAVKIGDQVIIDDVLASKKAKFGLGKTTIKSPVNGLIIDINRDNGMIIINIADSNIENEEVLVSEKPVKQISITKKSTYVRPSKTMRNDIIEAIFGFGMASGRAWFIEHEFSQKMIIPEMKDKIIICKGLPTTHEFYKASAVGVAGIISGSDDLNQAQVLGQELASKIHLGFLLLPERFNLSKLHNKQLHINGQANELLVAK